MRTSHKLTTIVAAGLFAAARSAPAQATFTDDFSTPINYLTQGVSGTVWDGVYLGAGAFAHPTDAGMAPGSVSVADAGISSNGILTVASLQTDWENIADDGFFLFKVIRGDFDMSVEIVGPIDHHAHNFPGLMVRAFGPQGAPAPGGKENYFIWGRFDEYNIANMLKNNTNGAKRDSRIGSYPNTNYWLRIQRVAGDFKLSEKSARDEVWTQVGSVTRHDFEGLPLQVGIEHADYDGGRTLKAGYRNFSLTASNMGPFSAAPGPATDLKSSGKGAGEITWTPGKGSSGSVVVIWPGNSPLMAAPSDGTSYHGAPGFGAGDALPAVNHFVVYSGVENRVTVTNLPAGTNHTVAVFSYSGDGDRITYNHTPAIAHVDDGQ